MTPPSSDPLPMHIATRGSRLALWQANTTRELLGEEHELLIVRSSGDADRTTDLARFGSIGIFTVEVDRAILDGRARIGVHSLKDMTTTLQDGIVLAGCLARGPVEDVLVSRDGRGLRDLPSGSRVGTGSLRRGAMIRTLRSDVEVVSQRGNVPTRVSHVVDGDLDACVLARAGLERLGLAEHVAEVLSLDDFLPAVGQGIVGITCREDDHEVRELLGERVRDPLAWPCALAERAFLRGANGGCNAPIAGHATLEGEQLRLRGRVHAVDGAEVVAGERRGPSEEAESLGAALAEELLAAGAAALIEQARELES